MRTDAGRTVSVTGKDKRGSHSNTLGKRKREQSLEVADDQTKQQPAEQDKECMVCLELVAETSFPDTKHASGHEHSSDVCLSCWNQHIESEMRSKNFEGISCLHCPHKLVKKKCTILPARALTPSMYSCLDIKESMLTCRPGILTEAPRAACSRMKSSSHARVPTALGVCTSMYPR